MIRERLIHIIIGVGMMRRDVATDVADAIIAQEREDLDEATARKIGAVAESDLGTVTVPLTDLRELFTAALECAAALEGDIEFHYPSREVQPIEMRRFRRDMSVVIRVQRALLAMEAHTKDIVAAAL